MSLDFSEGKELIHCYWGTKSFYTKPGYSRSDGLYERINIHRITKKGFNKFINEKGYDSAIQLVKYLLENINRWDGDDDYDIDESKDKIQYANNRIYYFGTDSSLLLFSIIDMRKDFTQSLRISENHPLIGLNTESLIKSLKTLSVEWKKADVSIRWGDGGSYVKHLKSDIVKMLSEYIYHLLENNKSINDVICAIDPKMFWEMIDLSYSRPHKKYDMYLTLRQVGIGSYNCENRSLFTTKYFEECCEKYGSFGRVIGYVYIFWCWMVVLYGTIYKGIYEIVKNK